ncbi:MAG: type II toxin-antitoxin system HicB family antitoxin [Sphaerobacteraceae bacterium]|nr:MAG: type II toxin-antitoxin system HicB family antitoxin [Sphaerobacteraceae bacterium]
MARTYQVLLEWDPDDKVWVTYVPHLDFLSTFGDTREEALEHTREAILLYLEGLEEHELETYPNGTHAELVEVEVPAS